MITLMLASDLAGREVVTLGGDAVARVKDTVFDAAAGRITGFTLSGRGLLAGPLKQSLPFSAVHALGPAAVMIPSAAVLDGREAVLGSDAAGGGAVIGAPVITDQGTEIGTVRDVVVEAGTAGHVIGFEIAAHDNFDARRRKVFVPRGQTLAVSGEALVVPARARHFVADDLPSFGAQVEAFRAGARLPEADSPPSGPPDSDIPVSGEGDRA
ncbi:PRC-barrel domain-containing protein [Streptomyces naphthomycinicus]|uniref:PRC-barrel domain-containing protein n=1 Tax=Streptomyces naphthomycinicus TaxID=2872625 RepID=UPI001CECC1F5|nr:PRC-barrel domain-containing protein [Streptomyces sp. TML10]